MGRYTYYKSQESFQRRKIEAPPWPPKPKRRDVKKKPIKFGKVNAPFNPRVKQINDCYAVYMRVCLYLRHGTRSIRASSTYNIVLQLYVLRI